MRKWALKAGLFLLFLASVCRGISQTNDNFSDGDFTTNPAWVGNTSDWMVNASQQLQSNNTVASSTFYLSTANTLATVAQWELYINLAFNTSSANYADIYLTASASDLTQGTTTGYFVRIGDTQDEISLYRKDGASSVKIIDGTDGVTNSSNNTLKIKVIRDAASQWTLFRDISGTGSGYVSEGIVVDATFTTSSFFGIFVKQSTASFFQKHFFDDIEIRNYMPDVTPPAIQSVTAIASNAIDVLFNEPVSTATSQALSNYNADHSIGSPITAMRDASNNALVHLSFGNSFPNGVSCTLTVSGVEDLSGNAINNGTGSFSFYSAQRYDIVIDELMADPTPQVGLPNNEWIELKNTTGFPINLQGWRISDASSTSGPMQNFILQPDSFVIACTGSAVAAMSAFGTTIAVTSFPSLDNDGDRLSLISADGKIIHSLSYTISWYQNELKKDGGWTLEMIDPKNPCTGGSNWKASTNTTGGTPGKKNSIDGTNNDQISPSVKRAYVIDAVTIVVVFDEPVDSLSGATVAHYSIDGGLSFTSSATIAPLFDEVQLKLNNPMQPGTVYNITVNSVNDCKGNTIGVNNKTRVGLPTDISTSEIVINEILFNPKPNAYDYVEFYNKTNKIFDASKMYIANRNSSGSISSINQLSITPWLVFPGDYIVVTQDLSNLQVNYLVKNPGWVLTLSSLPSFSDDKGFVILLDMQGNIVDEVDYLDDWHFKLIDNDEGVSLERIDPNGPSQDASNWHSAASTEGYGTPTYKNSQFKNPQGIAATIEVTPKVFSPDNDGFNDIATIQYKIDDPGYVANITIFDAAGRPVKNLVRNGTLSTSGYWNWDGLNDKGQKLPVGTYIVFTEIFNLQGKKETFKNTLVLARKLN